MIAAPLILSALLLISQVDSELVRTYQVDDKVDHIVIIRAVNENTDIPWDSYSSTFFKNGKSYGFKSLEDTEITPILNGDNFVLEFEEDNFIYKIKRRVTAKTVSFTTISYTELVEMRDGTNTRAWWNQDKNMRELTQPDLIK